jgi:phospholipid/cholesterol/gamma-HCH transport system ATP-binding protein
MIKVKDIHKIFGAKCVLNGVNLEVCNGETVVIIGSSGEGKSVLLKTIVGLIKPDYGSVEIDDVDITKCSMLNLQRIQKKIGYVFQEAALFDSLNVFENVAFGLKTLTSFTDKEIKQKVEQCLAMVGLKNIEYLKPSGLSGGMKKRVALARAIAYQPNYILYDEPTTGLDPIMSDVINNIIIDLRNRFSITSIVVTHDMQSAYRIADRILMLHKGNIIFNGTPNDIRNTKNKYVKQFTNGCREGLIEINKISGMERI